MTRELAHALADGLPPFHDAMFVAQGLSREQVAQGYRAISHRLAASLPAGVALFEADDWDGHDGFITPGAPLERDRWLQWSVSAETIQDAWAAEDYCDRAVWPQSMEWLLRFGLCEDVSNDACGQIDFTGDRELVDELSRLLQEACSLEPSIVDPGQWFLDHGHTGFRLSTPGSTS